MHEICKGREKYPEFKFLEINGVKVKTPKKIYEIVFKCFKNKTSKNYEADLNKMFEDSKFTKRPFLVLLLDELDFFINKSKNDYKVIFNFFEWALKANSKLIVIGVANTLDLFERHTHAKIASRLNQKIVFEPYNFDQLVRIILSRLQSIEIFEKKGIELVARKIASYCGDARKALQICRSVAQKFENDSSTEIISIQQISQCIEEMNGSVAMRMIKSNFSSLQEF